VLIGAVPPIMLKTDANPGGLPMSTFDGILAGVASNRSQFYRDLAVPFYGYNRPNAKTSQGKVRQSKRTVPFAGTSSDTRQPQASAARPLGKIPRFHT
jgi:hypothetical protein